jgi:hypothetical protein
MKRHLLILISTLVFCFTGKATVTNVFCYDDYTYFSLHGGHNSYAWNSEGMDMAGNLYGNMGDHGSIYGNIYTDSPEDPTFTIHTAVDNDTSFGWASMHVNVWMANTFTISAPTVYYPTTTQAGWSGVIATQPLFNGSVWVGELDYTGPVPIGIGETLDFSYKITFTGAVDYPFTQQMVPAPEPSAFSLVMVGGLLLGGWKMARRRAVANCR